VVGVSQSVIQSVSQCSRACPVSVLPRLAQVIPGRTRLGKYVGTFAGMPPCCAGRTSSLFHHVWAATFSFGRRHVAIFLERVVYCVLRTTDRQQSLSLGRQHFAAFHSWRESLFCVVDLFLPTATSIECSSDTPFFVEGAY
jgi:hypothetical protein